MKKSKQQVEERQMISLLEASQRLGVNQANTLHRYRDRIRTVDGMLDLEDVLAVKHELEAVQRSEMEALAAANAVADEEEKKELAELQSSPLSS